MSAAIQDADLRSRGMRLEANAFLGFFERQRNLYRRYWVWEVVWLVYSIVSTLSIGYLASGLDAFGGSGAHVNVAQAQLYLLIGSLLWSYLSLMFFDVSFAIAWERWEGTIEYTFMAPVRRVTHLLGICSFAIVYAMLRSVIILAAIALAFHLDLSHADIGAALLVLAAATFPVLGLGIFTSVLPLLSPEKGEQMTVAVQGVLLLVSGVYYPLTVLPAVFRIMGDASPLTYTLTGMRAALLDHAGAGALLGTILLLLAMGAVLIPCGVLVFAKAERRAKRLGLLKRNG
ncbi:MAG TPA: ABC transporter permease [Candidatus Dormibacteraeota bacterium]